MVWRLPEQEPEWTGQTWKKKRKANPNRLALKETLGALQRQELRRSRQDILMVVQQGGANRHKRTDGEATGPGASFPQGD